ERVCAALGSRAGAYCGIGAGLPAREPLELGDVIRRPRLAGADASRPVQVQRRRGILVVAVAVDPDSDQLERLDLHSRLLAQLSPQSVERLLAFFEKSTRQIPFSRVRIVCSPGEQETACAVDAEGGYGRSR